MMTTHYSGACPRLLTHSTCTYTQPLNKVKCTEGEWKSQRAKNITDMSLVPLLRTTACPYTWIKISERQQACTETEKNTEAMFSLNRSFGKRTGKRRSKESWLTLGPVIKKLFTDLEKETAYSLREAQCPSQIPLLTSLISALCNMLNRDTSGHPKPHWTILLSLFKSF